MAFDAGLFSFRDVDFYSHHPYYHIKPKKNEIFSLITNPKNIKAKTLNRREPYSRIKHSTHIRILVFSKYKIKNVQVYIDNTNIGQAKLAKNDSNLYTIEWIPFDYLVGMHKIKTISRDHFNNIDLNEHEFTLENRVVKSFGFFASFVLLNDQVKFVSIFNDKNSFKNF